MNAKGTPVQKLSASKAGQDTRKRGERVSGTSGRDIREPLRSTEADTVDERMDVSPVPSRHPSPLILHHPLGKGDEGLKTIPKRGGERQSGPSLTTAPQGGTKDEGCRIISSSDLLDRSQKVLAAAAEVQLWGLHVRAGAVTLFIGETSVGKTVFLHNLAYHLAAGQEFLGLVPPRPLRVLNLDFESYADIFAEHLSTIGTAPGWDFLDPKGLESGETLIKTLETLAPPGKYDVIIVDPLMEAYPVKDENDNALANSQMLAFRKLARSSNAGVIVVHNSGLGKPGKRRSEKFLGRGATSRVDRADVSINFTSTGTNNRRLSVTKARGRNLNEEINFRFAAELSYELLSQSPTANGLVDIVAAEIIALITTETAAGRPDVERKTILQQLNTSNESAREQAIDRALSKNMTSGALVKVRKGTYKLKTSNKATAPAVEADEPISGQSNEMATSEEQGGPCRAPEATQDREAA
jgi:hypothetical protein